jgi:large subunit ribosomal protein L24
VLSDPNEEFSGVVYWQGLSRTGASLGRNSICKDYELGIRFKNQGEKMKAQSKNLKSLSIRRGDEVAVIAGKDKGKKGKVLSVSAKSERVVVEGVNIVKRHVKPSQLNPQGGIVTKEIGIHVSNVMVVDPKTGAPSRIGVRMEGDKKVRFAKKSGTVLPEVKA